MRCPVCDQTLRTTEKFSVPVEICPDCKGVWSDRGALERMVEAATKGAGGAVGADGRPAAPPVSGFGAPPDPQTFDRGRSDDYRRRHHDDHDDDDEGGGLFGLGGRQDDRGGENRKGSWISNLFRGFHD